MAITLLASSPGHRTDYEVEYLVVFPLKSELAFFGKT